MNRHAFYILIAFLTFGMSSVISLNFWFNFENQAHVKTQNAPPRSETLQSSNPKEIEYVCQDEIINQLADHLKTSEFVQRINTISIQRVVKDDQINCSDIYQVRKIDLNKDKKQEVIVIGKISGLCNMRGNCELWGFRKTRTGYEQILRHEWAFDYKISSELTKGFSNIEIDANSSNGNPSNYLHIFKYDGRTYQMKDCFAIYEFDGGKELKKPKRVREQCEQ